MSVYSHKMLQHSGKMSKSSESMKYVFLSRHIFSEQFIKFIQYLYLICNVFSCFYKLLKENY